MQDQKNQLKDRGICVVIPVYNNEKSIRDVVMRSLAQCDDVIVVNDGSTNSTGEILHPSEAFCHIIDMGKMVVEFSVPEKEIGVIQIGDKAEATFPGLNNMKRTIEIADKSFVSNPLGHTYTIKARVPVEDKDILPGMVAKILLSLSETSGIVVPSSCVLTMPEGANVWTVKNGKAYRRNIKVGGFVKNGVVVDSGLESGDTIITVGYQKLYNGAKVSF